MKRTFGITLVALLVLALAGPAAAITNGVPDGDDHPMVGQLFFHVPDVPDPRFDDPGAWFTCTGTLLSPTVLLTAGHCTYAIGLDGTSTVADGGDGNGGNDVWVTFEEEPTLDDILLPSTEFVPDNAARYEAWSEALEDDPTWIRGTATSHPDYDDGAFFLFDAGVVVLDDPVVLDEYGELPEVGYLDQVMRRKPQERLFTAVGYGATAAVPFPVPGDNRLQATTRLIEIRGTHGIPAGTSAKFSNNRGTNHTGGTCFGDSGGPIFEQGSFLIGAIVSYGVSPCVGNDGAYRIDKAADLAWIQGFL